MRSLNVTCFISASRRSSSHLEVTRTELEKCRSVLHGLIGYSRSRFICRLGHLRSTNTINTSRTSSNIRRNICNNAHPSLRSLLQTLQERRHIVVVVDGELHVLSHNPNGHILEETSSRSHDVKVVKARVQRQDEISNLSGQILLGRKSLPQRAQTVLHQVVQVT